MPLGCSKVTATVAHAGVGKTGEGGFWGRLTLEGPTFPGLKEPPCSQGFRAFVMMPIAQPPPAATSHSPLKATIDMDPTQRQQ